MDNRRCVLNKDVEGFAEITCDRNLVRNLEQKVSETCGPPWLLGSCAFFYCFHLALLAFGGARRSSGATLPFRDRAVAPCPAPVPRSAPLLVRAFPSTQ